MIVQRRDVRHHWIGSSTRALIRLQRALLRRKTEYAHFMTLTWAVAVTVLLTASYSQAQPSGRPRLFGDFGAELFSSESFHTATIWV